MTTTPTGDVDATLRQIAEVTAAGCDIVRVAVPTPDDAVALPTLVRRSPLPIIADIHFQPRYVFAAIDAGCAAVRVNPGNTKQFDDRVGEIAKAAAAAGIPIRVGVNAGSLDPRMLSKHGSATAAALVEQVKAGNHILQSLGMRPRQLEIVSCPGCGRVQVDIHRLAQRVEAAFDGFPYPLRVAVMGCVMNGPGESREADLGVSSGNGKGQIFVRGRVVRTVAEHQIVEALLAEAVALTENAGSEDTL
ncbi:flavodoxin-dependent (E)-4-hydroxy-3-methylbut-2-enyl-diphosphate synthase [Nocardia sp. NPDC059239]|uniref:flavodoxin-dependent (E)-4-hydroxy-3-methylbut-2-enyl-diphosphate synthase n=1 Tax=unclassified Nocardia TaxID=2637762 RepID=UPI00367C2245